MAVTNPEMTPDGDGERAAPPERVDGQPSGDAGGPDSTRRTVLAWAIAVAAGAFAAAFAVPALALKSLMLERPVLAAGDTLVYAGGAGGAQAGQPFHPPDLAPGTSVQLLPRGKADNQDNLVQVVRIGPGEGVAGLVAFSAICTHLGCAVFEKLGQDGLISCPCHGSRFDPARQAAVVLGPADRALPALPIALGGDGTVVASGPFSSPIGPR